MKNLISFITVTILTLTVYSQVRVEGSTGFTTIGGITPATETLEVKGNAIFGTQGLLKLQQQSGQSAFDHSGSQPMYFRTTGTSAATIVFSTDTKNRLAVSKTGNIRFFNTGGQLANKSGDAFWNVVSDANLKTNVKDYNEGLDALMKIRPVTFSYNFKSVNPNAFLFMLINGIQELQQLNETQKTKLDQLSAEMEELKRQMAHLRVGNTQVDLKGNASAKLIQNIPNPFTHSTNIEYFVPSDANNAKVVFTDVHGNTIKTIKVEQGNGTIDVSVEGLAKGIYIYSLVVDGIAQDSKRMIVE